MADSSIEALETEPKQEISIMLEVAFTASELDRALTEQQKATEAVILAQAAHREAFRQLDDEAKLRALEIPHVAEVQRKINSDVIDRQLRA